MLNGRCPKCGSSNEDIAIGDERNLRPRTILHGQYYLGKSIGRGGFGITYIAYDLRNKKKVAIKEYMPKECCLRSENRRSVKVFSDPKLFKYGLYHFTTEAKILYKLRDLSGIANVEKLFQENNTQYFAMEYLEGMDLAKFAASFPEGKIPWKLAIEIIAPVLDTLSIVHQNNLIHRDISPDNLFMCNNGVVKLIDFGAASADFGDKSMTSKVILKRGFAPIEQYALGNHTNRIDIYAIGSTLYNLITGVVPQESTARHPVDNMKEAIVFCPDIPKSVNAALKKAMAVNSDDRYSSVLEFKKDLMEALDIPKPPPPIDDDPFGQESQEGVERHIVKDDKASGCNIQKMNDMPLSEYLISRLPHGILSAAIALAILADYDQPFIFMLMVCVPTAVELISRNSQWSENNSSDGLRLCDSRGQCPSIGKTLLRIFCKYIILWIAALTAVYINIFIAIALITMVFSADLFSLILARRTIHDFIASSYYAPYEEGSSKLSKSRISEMIVQEHNEQNKNYRLQCISGHLKGLRFDLMSGHSYKLGRSSQKCDLAVPLNTPGISSEHCSINIPVNGRIELKDLDSSFGTFLNGEKIAPQCVIAIKEGDNIKLGNSIFVINQM